LTCTQSCDFFFVGVGLGVGVGVCVGVGVGVVAVGVGVGDELAAGVGLLDGVGVGEGAGSELACALGVGTGVAEGVGDADGAADAEGLDAAGDELCIVTAAAKVAPIGRPLRALTVAAGRVAHGPAAAAGLTRAFWYARATAFWYARATAFWYARATAWWEELLPTRNSPTMRPKMVTPNATNRARRSITDTISPPCRPARGYRPSPP
jgi:hypothetical protein